MNTLRECVVCTIKGDLAYVDLGNGRACNGCKGCALNKGKIRLTPAINEAQCKVGDTVRVRLAQRQARFGWIVLYLLPIAALFLGFFAGFYGLESEIFGGIFGLLLCVASFGLIYLLDKKLYKKRFMPVVVEVIATVKEEIK